MRRGPLVPLLVLALLLLPGTSAGVEHDDDGLEVAVYLLVGSSQEGAVPQLVPVARAIDDTPEVAHAAVEALLDGPTDAEAASAPAVMSEIPDGVTLNGIDIDDDGLATVDLSAGFEAGGGSASMQARLAQLVFTVTQFTAVDGIALELDGVPTTVFSGEGLLIEPPVGRAYFEDDEVLPPVLVEEPTYGGEFEARLAGTSALEEFEVGVYDGDGRLLGDAVVTVDDVDTRSRFDVTVPYVSLSEGMGSVIVEGTDGTLREYPVTLTPTPVPAARGIEQACPSVEVPASDFLDVEDDGVHTPAIECIAWLGITEGRTATSFAPSAQITRGQFAAMVARALRTAGEELPEDPAAAFTDVAGTTHALEIDQLAALGIVRGRADDTYAPDGRVTRAQTASILVRTFEHVTGATLEAERNYFTDDDGSVHAAAIDAAGLAGLTTGLGPEEFGPGMDLRRDEMATLVARLLDLLVVEGGVIIDS